MLLIAVETENRSETANQDNQPLLLTCSNAEFCKSLFLARIIGQLGKQIITPKVLASFQPRVELWQPWDQMGDDERNPERVCWLANPFGVGWDTAHLFPGLPKLNPGLELANTFGVGFCLLLSVLVAAMPRCVTNRQLLVFLTVFYARASSESSWPYRVVRDQVSSSLVLFRVI